MYLAATYSVTKKLFTNIVKGGKIVFVKPLNLPLARNLNTLFSPIQKVFWFLSLIEQQSTETLNLLELFYNMHCSPLKSCFVLLT